LPGFKYFIALKLHFFWWLIIERIFKCLFWDFYWCWPSIYNGISKHFILLKKNYFHNNSHHTCCKYFPYCKYILCTWIHHFYTCLLSVCFHLRCSSLARDWFTLISFSIFKQIYVSLEILNMCYFPFVFSVTVLREESVLKNVYLVIKNPLWTVLNIVL
jgi:hypothetical protein